MPSSGRSLASQITILITTVLSALLMSHAVEIAPIADQIEAVQGLLERLLPPHHVAIFRLSILSEISNESAALFEVSVDPTGGSVDVKGTSGVGMPSCLLVLICCNAGIPAKSAQLCRH